MYTICRNIFECEPFSVFDVINELDFSRTRTSYNNKKKDKNTPEEKKRRRSYDCGLEIANVIFNNPATIVQWKDGTKTIVKCQKSKGDSYSKETGLAMAIVKKVYGNDGTFNEIFKKWVGDKQE